jgi:hypothetical protein
MTQAQETQAQETHAEPHGEVHDEHHVHVYETSGISEGNARVPRWFVAVILALFGFFAYYVVTQWSAQPSTSRMKT